MAPTIMPRVPSGTHLQHLSRSLTSALFSKITTRDVTSTATPLASVFALILTSSSTVSRRALTSLAELSSQQHPSSPLTARSAINSHLDTPVLLKRQNAILCIPATYAGLNAGPPPGTVVGATLGAVFGFILLLYLILFSFQVFSGRSETIVKEEVTIKRRSSQHSRARSHRSSHHSAAMPAPDPIPLPPPSRRGSRRETIVEIEEEIIRHGSRHHSPSLSPDEVIVEEEESRSDEIVEVIEEGSSYMSVSESTAPPAPRPSSNGRRSGYRIVDPAEMGGGDAPMRRMSRRDSRS